MVGKKRAQLSHAEVEVVRQYLVAHKDEIRDDTLSPERIVEELKKKHGITPTLEAIASHEKRLRKANKLPLRDGLVVPFGEFEGTKPLRKSERLGWIRRHKNWPVERLQAKLGFVDQLALRQFARRYHIKLGRSSTVTPSKKLQDTLLKQVREYLTTRIAAGDLVRSDIGTTKLYEQTRALFGDRLREAKISFTKASFPALLDEVIWSGETLTALEHVVELGLPLETFSKRHANFVPHEMVEAKAKWLSGVSNSRSRRRPPKSGAGILRLGGKDGFKDVPELELPATSFREPYEVEVPDPRYWAATHINGTNIGLTYRRLIEQNPVRQALARAADSGHHCVFWSNIVDFEMTKATGPLRIIEALSSGIDVNVDLMDEDYAEEAARILETVPDDEIIYQTTAETWTNLMGGLSKISYKPTKSGREPEFPGRVYVILGYKEEAVAAAAAYWEMHYITVLKRLALEAELKGINSAIGTLKRHLKKLQEEGSSTSDGMAQTLAKLNDLEDDKERVASQLTKTRVTFWAAVERRRFFRKALAFVIKSIEDAIPNCTVIGKGSTFVQIGSTVVEFNIPHHLRVTDALLQNFNASYGPRVIDGTLPPTVIICHPHALYHDFTARERDAEGVRWSSGINVAPITVDAGYLRRRLSTLIRGSKPAVRAVFSAQFESGVLELEHCMGQVYVSPVKIGALSAYKKYRKINKNRQHLPLQHGNKPLYIWNEVDTDKHVGSPVRAHVYSPELEAYLGPAEAWNHMLRKQGFLESTAFPIHCYISNDDETQGHHFENHKQPHHQKMPYMVIERKLNEIMAQVRSTKKVKEQQKLAAKMKLLFLQQLLVRGEFWVQDQMLEFIERMIEPEADFFSAVLRRAESSGLTFRGVGEFEGKDYDTRTPGAICYGTGNHLAKSADKAFTEGMFYKMALRSLLRLEPHWRDKKDYVEQMVRAPLYGNRFIAWGTMRIPGGYEWGIDWRDTPSKMGSWEAPLLAVIRNDLRRGNYSRCFDHRVTFFTCGDKHMESNAVTRHRVWKMGGSSTPTDLFGEWGFPPNATGISFVGLPADGPDAGPILFRSLRYDHLRYFVQEHPEEPFDVERFLPNPA